jgi:ligand-binding sensor domain-containing protein
VTVTPDAKLIVTTTDGVVWLQRDSEAVRPTPAAGDTMIIRKALLGSFLCSVGRSVAYRCSRRR